MIGFQSLASLAIGLALMLPVSIAFAVAAVKRSRRRDTFGAWQGIAGALGFAFLPFSLALGPLQLLPIALVAAACLMGLRGTTL